MFLMICFGIPLTAYVATSNMSEGTKIGYYAVAGIIVLLMVLSEIF